MRRHTFSGYDYEAEYGYARAVQAGDTIYVSGTTARGDDLSKDVFEQATSALALIASALAELDSGLDDVVRTVAYLRSMEDAPLLARAHREAFGKARPASTMVEVARLSPDEARVEIEVTAVRRNG